MARSDVSAKSKPHAPMPKMMVRHPQGTSHGCVLTYASPENRFHLAPSESSEVLTAGGPSFSGRARACLARRPCPPCACRTVLHGCPVRREPSRLHAARQALDGVSQGSTPSNGTLEHGVGPSRPSCRFWRTGGRSCRHYVDVQETGAMPPRHPTGDDLTSPGPQASKP
jgi:hypothetical protein